MSWVPAARAPVQRGLIQRFEERCTPDWLERVGCSPAYSSGSMWSLAGGVFLTIVAGWSVFWMLVPFFAWKSVTEVLPFVLWRRVCNAPRWAHVDFVLDASERDELAHWMSISPEWQRAFHRSGIPRTGKDLWKMISEVELAEEIAASLAVLRKEI